ncbi:hypothetical protein ACS5PU_08870 [Pedobacter sp. GSP4]|uniref:hypothetical protein n=1 Tax=Pedobacter sp. GSP4 TaxID=3453716 RepID=UPI003EF02A5A
MKYLFILLLLCTFDAKAQHGLTFDKRLLDCENKWIAIALDSGSKYAFGYVYLDNSAGLTFNLKGAFTIENDTYKAKNVIEVKHRITPTDVKVAIIPAEKLKQLNVEAQPLAYTSYIGSNNKNDRYFKLGQTYNNWKAYKMAWKSLNAISCDPYIYPNFGLEELVSENRENAKQVNTAFRVYNTNYNEVYKRDIFWMAQANKMKIAEETYLEAIRYCTDEFAKADMAYNIAYQYFKTSNTEKFNIWCKEVNRWITPNANYAEKIEKMQRVMGK